MRARGDYRGDYRVRVRIRCMYDGRNGTILSSVYFTGTEASERETCRVQVYNQYKEYFSTDMCGCLAK